VLQCVAVMFSVLQGVAVCCSVFHANEIALEVIDLVISRVCSALQYVVASCSVLQYVAGCCSALQYVVALCSVLQYMAGCCSML